MSQVRDHRWLRKAILPTIAISMLTTLVIGSLLYYTVKRHEVAQAREAAEATIRHAEQRAVAAGEVFAAASRSIILSDMSRLQELLTGTERIEGVRDAMIVSRDNTVLAARQATQVGHKLSDSTWASWKSQSRVLAQRAVDHAGRPVFVVVAPLKDKDDFLASAMLVVELPDGGLTLRAPMDRLTKVGQLMAPIFVCLLVSIGMAMKLATEAIRKQIQGVMADVFAEPSGSEEPSYLQKVS